MSVAPSEARPARPGADIAFTGNLIDPQSEHRSDDAAEKALADPAARLLLLRDGRLCMKPDGESFDPFFQVDEARALEVRFADAVLLGQSATGPVVAMPYAIEKDDLPEPLKAIDYRSIYLQGLLEPEALGALAQAAALLAWHENHRFCGRCGHETEMRAGGYRRHCAHCEREHFPRTDPVAIMLAVRGNKCLLGRSPHFMPGMYSCLAGFIEPGETIESAVRRETFEESGIRLGQVTYQASQPWPFPYSLMIGCVAEALSEEIDPDTSELEDCRWFDREEVRSMLDGMHEKDLRTPPKGAIAHHLIAGWVEG